MIAKRLKNAADLVRASHRNAVKAEQQASWVPSLLARERIEAMRLAQLAEGRIAGFGFKGYSQNDEDGIIQEIFRRIGHTNRVFIEFGCGDGLENNSLYLLLSGWSGVWIDGDPVNVDLVRKMPLGSATHARLKVDCSMLTAENIDGLLWSLCGQPEIDLLSIDIDGNDYWIWEAIQRISPRVVIVEYNATFRPPLHMVQAYRADAVWNGTNYFGSSLSAFEHLGRAKGYALVGCNLAGQNAFFVRKDCLKDQFLEPFTAENHYMPANYDLFPLAVGQAHPPGVGEYVLKP
jgi:hypothetical protein